MKNNARLASTALLAGLMMTAAPVSADDHIQEEVAALRQMIESMRVDYETRITELEQRLANTENTASTARAEAAEAIETAEDLAYQPQAQGSSNANTFNPGIGAIFIGTLGDVGLSEDDRAIPGFQLAGEPGPGDGFSIGETELNFNANVDDKFFGNLTFALADEDGELLVELEEAWIQSTGLPAGLQMTAGRYFSGIGYLNGFHLHADDFIDRPLPYQAFLAGQYMDDGVQLRWLAPSDTFLEFGAEIMKGDKFPGGDESDGQSIWTLFAKTGGDVGLSHSWKAGFSYLNADATARSAGHHGAEEEEEEHEHEHEESEEGLEGFFGSSELFGLEAIYKWAPEGNATQRNFKLQGEYFWREEEGIFDGLAYEGEQSGWYLQGIYQFRPGWRIGYRHDALDADNRGVEGTELDDLNFDPKRDSVFLEWFNSEFNRVRFQYTKDRSTLLDDDQLLLQYVMSIGSHRAHQF
jgi:hypothetical protein